MTRDGGGGFMSHFFARSSVGVGMGMGMGTGMGMGVLNELQGGGAAIKYSPVSPLPGLGARPPLGVPGKAAMPKYDQQTPRLSFSCNPSLTGQVPHSSFNHCSASGHTTQVVPEYTTGALATSSVQQPHQQHPQQMFMSAQRPARLAWPAKSSPCTAGVSTSGLRSSCGGAAVVTRGGAVSSVKVSVVTNGSTESSCSLSRSFDAMGAGGSIANQLMASLDCSGLGGSLQMPPMVMDELSTAHGGDSKQLPTQKMHWRDQICPAEASDSCGDFSFPARPVANVQAAEGATEGEGVATRTDDVASTPKSSTPKSNIVSAHVRDTGDSSPVRDTRHSPPRQSATLKRPRSPVDEVPSERRVKLCDRQQQLPHKNRTDAKPRAEGKQSFPESQYNRRAAVPLGWQQPAALQTQNTTFAPLYGAYAGFPSMPALGISPSPVMNAMAPAPYPWHVFFQGQQGVYFMPARADGAQFVAGGNTRVGAPSLQRL